MAHDAGQPVRGPKVERRRQGSVTGLAGVGYVSLASGLVTGPILARILGPAGRGEIAAITAYGMLMVAIGTLGLPLAVAHRAAHAAADRASLLAPVLKWSAATTLPAAGISWLLATTLLGHLSPGARLAGGLYLALAPVGILSTCLQAFLVAEGSLRPLARLQALPILIPAVTTLVLALVGALSVTTYLASMALATVVVAAGGWTTVGLRPAGGTPLGPLLRFGTGGVVAQLAEMANFRLDQAIMAPLVGTAGLGVYAVAVTVATLPVGLAHAIGSRSFATVAQGDRDERMATATTYLRLVLLTSVLAAVGLAMVGPVLMHVLYGRAFTGGTASLLMLLPGTVALCLSVTAFFVLTTLGRPGRVSMAQVSGLAVTVVGLTIALPRYGIEGAAVVSSLAYGVTAAVCLASLRQLGIRSLRPRREDVRRLAAAPARFLPPGARARLSVVFNAGDRT